MLFFGVYDDGTRQLDYVNRGHNAPFIRRDDGTVQVLDSTATVLGLFKDWSCEVRSIHLQPGDTRPSQTDLWAVLRTESGWMSLAVEAKAREPFGPTIGEWLNEASEGKRTRLKNLCETLGVSPGVGLELRYQLFHPAASAVLEARRIGAETALLLVHNFYPATEAWHDYQAFVAQFGNSACRNGVCEVTCPSAKRLLFAWVDSPTATDDELAALV